MVRGFVSRFPWRMMRAVCIVVAIVGMSAIGVFGAVTNMTSPRVIAPGAAIPIAVATPAAPAPIAEPRKLPCKQQAWPMIDRSCESWTADARKVEPPAPEPAPQQVAAPTVSPPSAAPQPIKAVPAEQPKRTAAVESPKAEPPKPAPAVIAAPKVEPPKVELKTELTKTEPAAAKVEPAKIESANAELAKVEPANIEPTAAPTEVETAQAVPLPRPRTGPRSKPETTRTEASAEPAAPKDTTKTEPKLKLADNAASTPAVVRLRRNPAPANAVPANAVPAPFPIQEFLAARR